jgi:LysM repeat protein
MAVIANNHNLYTVQPGDTLPRIASRFGTSIPAIEQANSIYPPFTDPGLI